MSDKKAKSNLLKGAAREIIEIAEKQKYTMWNKAQINEKMLIEDLVIEIEGVTTGYDENKKHVEALVKFLVNSENIVVTCYYTTQQIKVVGRGYLGFTSKFIKPLLLDRISKVTSDQIDQTNKSVIAALSGKRKAASRPMRSVKYKPMAGLPCTKCDASFLKTPQISKHKIGMHIYDSGGSIKNIHFVDDISLMDLSTDDPSEGRTKEISLEETFLEESIPTIVNLETTVKIETNNGEKIIYNCDKCEYSSLSESTLTDHTKSKPKECVNTEDKPESPQSGKSTPKQCIFCR